MDILERLSGIIKERGWTRYRLSKESGLSESTITNIFNRGNTPTVATLEIICNCLGITLAQFFTDGETVELTPELKELFDEWTRLNAEQRDALLRVMRAMKSGT